MQPIAAVNAVQYRTSESPMFARRGAYRASSAKWFHPESITADGSEADPQLSKAKRVKLKKSADKARTYFTQFKVPLQLAPVMLGFRLFITGETGNSTSQYIGPIGSRHFTIPVGLQAGHPLPQGTDYTVACGPFSIIDPCPSLQQPVMHLSFLDVCACC